MTTIQEQRAADDWAVGELDKFLEYAGNRYELVDGTLVLSPTPQPPTSANQPRVVEGPPGRVPVRPGVFNAPLAWQPDRWTSLEPDLLVVRKKDVGEGPLTKPLRLAVEILSPSSRLHDTKVKFVKYADGGVASYWIVDPDGGPSIVAYDLVDGDYVEVARATGDEEVRLERPYPVTVTPSALLG